MRDEVDRHVVVGVVVLVDRLDGGGELGRADRRCRPRRAASCGGAASVPSPCRRPQRHAARRADRADDAAPRLLHARLEHEVLRREAASARAPRARPRARNRSAARSGSCRREGIGRSRPCRASQARAARRRGAGGLAVGREPRCRRRAGSPAWRLAVARRARPPRARAGQLDDRHLALERELAHEVAERERALRVLGLAAHRVR